MDIKKRIEEIYPDIVMIRRDFHLHPELSEYEKRTSEQVSKYLSLWNIPYTDHVAGYGVVGIIEGQKKAQKKQKYSVIGIRADMDALPVTEELDSPFRSLHQGVMHACGHDIHTAILLGTAKILKELENEFSGTIKLFFQPAEETVGGAKFMIEEGHLEHPKVDSVIGLHVEPFIPCGAVEFCRGKMNATSSEFEITIEGKSCHAAYPNKGVDPLLPACHIVTAFQTILTRNLSATNPAIITVGELHSGTKTNVIPQFAKLTGTIRALDSETKDYMSRRMEEIVKYTAESFGAKSSMFFKDSYPALVNDDAIMDCLEKNAKKLLGEDHIFYMKEPYMGAEDFSFFSEAVPSAYFHIGSKKPNDENPEPLHSPYFSPDEECMKTGMLMEVHSALSLLEEE